MKNRTQKNLGGRPSTYTKKLGRRICEKIAESDVGLIQLHRMYDWFPAPKTIHKWKIRHRRFGEQYTLARRLQAERFALEQVEIADACKARTPQAVQKAKLQCESRRWAASRLAPQDFGDRMEIAGDKESPLVITGWADIAKLAQAEA